MVPFYYKITFCISLKGKYIIAQGSALGLEIATRFLYPKGVK
jgi:hypothetical protein